MEVAAVGRPQFWLIAGANGAGKSTLADREELQAILNVSQHFNPDRLASILRAKGVESENADLQAVQMIAASIDQCISDNQSLSVETVLSTDKYLRPTNNAKKLGYFIGMIYVALPR